MNNWIDNFEGIHDYAENLFCNIMSLTTPIITSRLNNTYSVHLTPLTSITSQMRRSKVGLPLCIDKATCFDGFMPNFY